MKYYNKIAKRNNIKYYCGQNRESSKHYFIICDFSKSKYAEKLDNPYEVVVAWIDKKTKSIEFNEETESLVNKDIIRWFVCGFL